MANLRYGFPSRKLKVIGVTGTDGKTTTTNMIYQILKAAGKKVSMVSTINAIIGDQVYDTGFHVTSPSPMDVQKFLGQAVNMESKYMVLEATSHALDQHRFWGIHFEVGVITNITHEHLDYHKSFENYFKAKAKLIKNVKTAILNRSEKHFERLSGQTRGKVLSFGLSKSAEFNPIKFPLKLSLPGEFNLLNALAASAVGVTLKIETKIIKQTLALFKSLAGRMQEIENNIGIKIVIDFAHTPNGLESALKALRRKTKGKLISVFGCAGLRDEQKRPLMGEISGKLSDVTIVTAEDPRGLIDQINKQIAQGLERAGATFGKTYFIELDRQKAIELAINKLADRGDTVGIFGKGHETSMNLNGKKEIPWSDLEAVKIALE